VFTRELLEPDGMSWQSVAVTGLNAGVFYVRLSQQSRVAMARAIVVP
jgi:hypothetical protein